MSEATIDSKNKFKDNPRKITESEMKMLEENLKHLGDLSGIIYCRKNKAYTGGNMRSEIMDGCKVEIIEEFKKPTKSKTVAIGYVHFNNEKFAYREVEFTKDEFDKACIVANSNGGSFDWDILSNDKWSDLPLVKWGVPIPDDWLGNGDNETKIKEENLSPVEYAHFLISVDINSVDLILSKIQEIQDLEVAQIETNVN